MVPGRENGFGRAIRGRLAPSPTGNLHLGSAFAFCCAALSTMRQKGTLVLRMEDIDPDRSRPAFMRGILEDLAWLGLRWQEGVFPPADQTLTEERQSASLTRPLAEKGPYGPYMQSRRLRIYDAAIQLMHGHGLTYPCFCTRKELRTLASAPHVGDQGVPYPGTCRSLSQAERARRIACGERFSLRLDTARALDFIRQGKDIFSRPSPGTSANLPGRPFSAGQDRPGIEALAVVFRRAGKPLETTGGILEFEDRVLGGQSLGLEQAGGDFALRRSDGVHAYQLAVALDDAAMGITEVVRGEDLLLSTPRQVLIFHLLGRTPPVYAHVPLVCDSLGERLAKRHGSLELAALREAGVRPEAIIGFLAYLSGLFKEVRSRTLEEMAEQFSFKRLTGRSLNIPENAVTILKKL